ncbi:MAG: diadenylate cyclase CdaA [Tissierellia bacterium]|nr:diadenylate cyclase CdaA [Tissierellia bacterium]
MRFWNELFLILSTIKITDIIDIIVITFLIYKLILLVKETRAEQLLKGIFTILFFSKISEALNLYAVTWLINNIFTVGMILIIVVFQPELRRAFEKLGRTNRWITSIVKIKREQTEFKAEEITSAVASLARQKIGALIVIENKVGLSDIAETGTYINGSVSSELLINIFIPNTPLHDGAVIIKDEKIVAAGCFLPLSTDQTVSKELGTRHRAAKGMSEKSDAFIIIVSEETGVISTATNGRINRYVDEETLRETLYSIFIKNDETILARKDTADENIKE